MREGLDVFFHVGPRIMTNQKDAKDAALLLGLSSLNVEFKRALKTLNGITEELSDWFRVELAAASGTPGFRASFKPTKRLAKRLATIEARSSNNNASKRLLHGRVKS